MDIYPIYTQRVLKAYNEQLSMRPRTSKGKKNSFAPGDVIMISPESKKKAMAIKIAQEIVNNLTKNSQRDRMAEEVMNQLSQTFGQSLEVVEKTGGEGLVFMVASEKQGEPPRYVSREENETLRQKLFDIAQTIVYRNLSKGGVE